MSTAAPSAPQAFDQADAEPPITSGPDLCPLCGGVLAGEQDWCLRCGAAARTRLAASPGWKGPAIAVALVATLALGVLAAALVKLAGGSGSSEPARTAVAAPPRGAAAGVGAAAAPTIAAGATAVTPSTAATPAAGALSSTGARAPVPGATTLTTSRPGSLAPRGGVRGGTQAARRRARKRSSAGLAAP